MVASQLEKRWIRASSDVKGGNVPSRLRFATSSTDEIGEHGVRISEAPNGRK
jgi:hypothetical protein